MTVKSTRKKYRWHCQYIHSAADILGTNVSENYASRAKAIHRLGFHMMKGGVKHYGWYVNQFECLSAKAGFGSVRSSFTENEERHFCRLSKVEV